MLRSASDDLADLAYGMPELLDENGGRTGIHLRKRLGVGGMATVFLAEREGELPRGLLSPSTPQRMALKFMQLSTARDLAKVGIDPLRLFSRESVALARLTERKPPTPFVVGFYGCGISDVETRHSLSRVPWLALEYVDGGNAGSSLTDRVMQARTGIDPVRALRLARGIVEGLSAIHDEKMVHRDLKPDNVLTAGPIDDEIPKLTDYGITRVEGIETVIAGATLAYAGFEQLMPADMRNPLIGPWSDVHALSAVIWFVLGGEQWFEDQSWYSGHRRSLRTAGRLHAGFSIDPDALEALDAVLARGAAPRIPQIAFDHEGASTFHQVCLVRYPAMSKGAERYADVASFAAELFPLLERAAAAWTERAVRDNVPATSYRATVPVESDGPRTSPIRVEEVPPRAPHPPDPSLSPLSIRPGVVAFQADGKVLAASGDRLFFFVEDQPYVVVPDAAARARIAEALFACHVGELGYAIVGPRAIQFLRAGRWRSLDLPKRADGGEVGDIQAGLGARGRLAVITAETEASEGGPELWRTSGSHWVGPLAIPLNGDVHAMAEGPWGMLLVGSKGGKRARASFLGPDGATNVYAQGVGNTPALLVAACGNERDAWAASESRIFRFDRSAAEVEHVDLGERPVQMALDLVGIPWLVSERRVLRREAPAGHTPLSTGGISPWRVLHRREESSPRFVAIGFTPEGARVLDEAGGSVRIFPSDVGRWRAPDGTASR
ncbi:MAG: protein kinase [Polyangiales bacterium]